MCVDDAVPETAAKTEPIAAGAEGGEELGNPSEDEPNDEKQNGLASRPVEDTQRADTGDEVVARIVGGIDLTTVPPGTKSPPLTSRDWWKPQYIDFANPLLVRLFAKLPGALSNFLIHLDERYPDTAALPAVGEGHYATEFILQSSSPAHACDMDSYPIGAVGLDGTLQRR